MDYKLTMNNGVARVWVNGKPKSLAFNTHNGTLDVRLFIKQSGDFTDVEADAKLADLLNCGETNF